MAAHPKGEYASHAMLAASPPSRQGLLRGLSRAPLINLVATGDSILAIALAAALTLALTALPRGLSAITPWLMAIVAVASLRGALGAAVPHLAARRSRTAKRDLRQRLLTAIFAARPGAAGGVGALSSAVVDEIEALDGYLVVYAPARANARLGPFFVIVAAAFASPVGAAILVATLIPFVAAMALAGGAAGEASRRQLEALARLSGLFADRVRALPLILAFQGEDRETARIGLAAKQAADRTLGVLRIAFISSAALEFFAALAVAMVAVYAGFSLLGLLPFSVPETLTFQRAFFVLALAPEVYAPMRRLAAAYHQKDLGEAAAGRLQHLLEAPRAPSPRPSTINAAPAIRYRMVSAGFTDDPDLTVGPANFEVPAGRILAVMGPTGAGKTTLLRLLVGESCLAAGEVEVGGQCLRRVGSFAPIIAWAGQSPLLLPGSIAHNIALASPGAARECIEAVAARTGLGKALAGRCDGLDTLIDERGSGLSGGERRRIGLARALLKDAPILILDEPTAELDQAAEVDLIEVIRRASRGRTVLMATHSDSLAAIADQVVRL